MKIIELTSSIDENNKLAFSVVSEKTVSFLETENALVNLENLYKRRFDIRKRKTDNFRKRDFLHTFIGPRI